MQNTTKEHNSVNLGGVMDFVFCMSHDDVLYLYQVSENISEFQNYGADTISKLKFTKGHHSIKT